ncbi:GSCOCT00014176001.2-RA-CDS [Cotesia congregata]|uniref:Gustatory receptor n=1 Tax=Cotesia congregata TaxID=51543 RepID=A0A8J2HDF9_COTCN|nr:GSCOCT00014176001.2-RA-CDS [Cotesia congregata]CAG5094926.1 gustatory receptor 79 [Cotesia congregata]
MLFVGNKIRVTLKQTYQTGKLLIAIMSDTSENSRFYAYLLFAEHFTSKLIGLSSWKMDTVSIFRKNLFCTQLTTFSYKLSIIGSGYNILLVVFYVLCDIFIIKKNLNETNKAPVSIKFAFFSILCISVIPVIYVIRQKILISVKNQIKDVDNELMSCLDYKLVQNNINYWTFIINNVLIYCWIVFMLIFESLWVEIISMLIPMIFGSILIVQYAMIMNMIEKRFKSINVTLLKLKSSMHRTIFNDISSIKFAYFELCDMCDNTADFYGIPTLIVIILFSIRNISNYYEIILVFLSEIEMQNLFYCSGIFAVQTFFLFTTLTTSVTRLLKQNEETSRIINQLLDQFTINQAITEKLSKFSSDLWHMKVEFTLCDIVPLDCSLLTIISGTTVTYLIIAVQFYLNKTDQE